MSLCICVIVTFSSIEFSLELGDRFLCPCTPQIFFFFFAHQKGKKKKLFSGEQISSLILSTDEELKRMRRRQFEVDIHSAVMP